jgi:hypothetical protein
MPDGKVINIGELKNPMNGALWVRSHQWALSEKMDSDFTPQLLVKLNDRKGEVRGVQGPVPPFKAIVLTGNSTYTGASTGIRKTGQAIGIAAKHGVWNPVVQTGKALLRVLSLFKH